MKVLVTGVAGFIGSAIARALVTDGHDVAGIERPQSPHGVTKLAAEQLCSLYAANFSLPTVSLRYFTVYGPGQRPDMAFTRFFRAALSGRPLTVHGSGKPGA